MIARLPVCNVKMSKRVQSKSNSELDLWQHKWKSDSELAVSLCTPEKSLVHADCDFFPNIHTLLCIMGTLPVTSCECERSISMLKLIKTSLRSSMGQDRLNGLAMLYYHRDIEITSEEVVDEFSSKTDGIMTI